MEGFGVVLVLQYFYGTNLDSNAVCIYSRQTSDGGTIWSPWEKYIKASGDTFTAPINTKNINTTGNLVVSGNIRTGSLNVTGATVLTGTMTLGGSLTVNNELKVVQDITCNNLKSLNTVSGITGTFTGNLTCVYLNGTAYRSQLADLAEKYSCLDRNLPIGTIVEISDHDDYEMQQCNTVNSEYVWGAVSSNETAAYIMNNNINMPNSVLVGLIGKLPIRIVGPVKKRDKIISFKNGVGIAAKDNNNSNYFAISLETINRDEEKLVMCLIGFNKRK